MPQARASCGSRIPANRGTRGTRTAQHPAKPGSASETGNSGRNRRDSVIEKARSLRPFRVQPPNQARYIQAKALSRHKATSSERDGRIPSKTAKNQGFHRASAAPGTAACSSAKPFLSTRNVTKPMTNAMAAVPSATGTRLPRSASDRPGYGRWAAPRVARSSPATW